MELLTIEMEMVLSRQNRSWSRFSSGHTVFEMSNTHPIADVGDLVGYMSLEIWRELRAGDRNSGVVDT